MDSQLFSLGSPVAEAVGTGVVFGTVGYVEGRLPFVTFLATSEAGYETSQQLTLPAGAVVTGAVLTVSAEPPEFSTPVGGIGTVRASAGAPGSSSSELVIDFGVLRTVSSVTSPVAITSISAWRGTSFDQWVWGDTTASTYAEFTEVQTERLLVGLSSLASPASFATAAKVTTTTPPADLELLVGGSRAWTRAGAVPAAFSEQVDVTAALQAALEAIQADAEGNVAVPVVLRARVPGTLGLQLATPISYLRTHPVSFPGTTTTRGFDEEGELSVLLPLPDGAADWIVHRVIATVTATDDAPERVLPPIGPAETPQVTLVLDPDRRLVVRVPAQRFARFEQLAGIRVSAKADPGGVELAGALLADAGEAPGDPVPKGTLSPLTLPASDTPAFVTIPLPQPVKVSADAPVWLSLAATRGSATLGLGAGGDDSTDATLRRVMPNGAIRPMSNPVGVRTDVLRLRLVGVPPALAPIAIVEVDLDGAGTVAESVEPTLAAAGLHSIALATPGPRPGLALRLTATAATAVTIGPVVVAYADPASGGS